MTVAAVFMNFANRSQPISSGSALILNPGVSFEEVEAIIDGLNHSLSVQTDTSIKATLNTIVKAVESKSSVCELKVITLDTELFD